MLFQVQAILLRRKLKSLPAVAAQNGSAAADLVIKLGQAAQGNDALTAAVIRQGLAVLPAAAAENGYVAANLVIGLGQAAQGNDALTAAVITEGLAVLPAVAAESGDAAACLRTKLGQVIGNNVQGELVCREFMISASGGRRDDRTVICFGDTPEQTIAIVGCFSNSLPMFQSAVENTHPEGSPHRQHYEKVLATAFEAIAHRKTLPSFAQSPVTVRAAVPANA